MEHKVTVTASGHWGIQQLNFNIDFWNSDKRKTIPEIKKDIMGHCLLAGYTAILHFSAIDDNKDAVTFLRLDNEAVADEYIRTLDTRLTCLDELESVKARDDEWAEKYGQQRIDFLNRMVRECDLFFRFTKQAYELIGIDVNDTETKSRILNNLGFYRTI